MHVYIFLFLCPDTAATFQLLASTQLPFTLGFKITSLHLYIYIIILCYIVHILMEQMCAGTHIKQTSSLMVVEYNGVYSPAHE